MVNAVSSSSKDFCIEEPLCCCFSSDTINSIYQFFQKIIDKLVLYFKGYSFDQEGFGDAIYNNDLDAVKIFINYIDVNLENKSGSTPLHSAVWGGNLEIVEALLKIEEIDVNLKNNHGNTPLHGAVMRGHLHGAVHGAVTRRNLEIVKALLGKDINVNLENKDGKTPLSFAKEKNLEEIIEILENHPSNNYNNN